MRSPDSTPAAARPASADRLAAAPADDRPVAPPSRTKPTGKAAPDTPAAARGRRTLSAAFVRVGPDGYLTVERSDGRVLVLRDVVMRPADYCGVQIAGDRY